MRIRKTLMVAAIVAAVQTGATAAEIEMVQGKSRNGSVVGTDVVSKEDGLFVSGWVKRRYPNSRRIKGAVEMLLLDADRQILGRRTIPLRNDRRPPQHQRRVGFTFKLGPLTDAVETIHIQPRTNGPAL